MQIILQGLLLFAAEADPWESPVLECSKSSATDKRYHSRSILQEELCKSSFEFDAQVLQDSRHLLDVTFKKAQPCSKAAIMLCDVHSLTISMNQSKGVEHKLWRAYLSRIEASICISQVSAQIVQHASCYPGKMGILGQSKCIQVGVHLLKQQFRVSRVEA